MRIPRIHTTQTLAPQTTLQLEASPSRHIARALRMAPGDRLALFDGRGGEFTAEVMAIDKAAVTVRTTELRACTAESALDIHLGTALSRGERMDWVVQKATELGVTRISPLLTEYTGVKLSADREQKKRRHWQQIAVSACEQCGRCVLPEIGRVQNLRDWLAATHAAAKLILHPRGATGAPLAAPDSVALLVGPEGGFSDTEINVAAEAGYQALRLGPRTLRTETAPLAALAILQARWGDMQPD